MFRQSPDKVPMRSGTSSDETPKDTVLKGSGHFYRFGPFRLYVTERELFREDEPVALTPKALDTLLALVRPLRAKIDETASLVVITEQGEKRNQT